MKRILVIVSHPIQYYVPWFRYLYSLNEYDLMVCYYHAKKIYRYDDEIGRTNQWKADYASGIKCIKISNAGCYILRIAKLLTSIVKHQPDICILYGYSSVFNILQYISPYLRHISIFQRGDSHGMFRKTSSASLILRSIKQMVMQAADCSLVVGKANYRYYLRDNLQLSSLLPSRHAVDIYRYRNAYIYKKDNSTKIDNIVGTVSKSVCLQTSKLTNKKQVVQIISLFSLIKCLRHILVGDGPLKNRIESLASISDSIKIPFIDQNDIDSIYSCAEFNVLPSFAHDETWGLSINEALCSYRRIIVSSHVGSGYDFVDNITKSAYKAGDYKSALSCLSNNCDDSVRSVSRYRLYTKDSHLYTYRAQTRILCRALKSM